MLIKFLGYKVKKQLTEWLPAFMVFGILVNVIAIIVGLIAVVSGLQGYNDNRYPPNAVSALVHAIVIFIVTTPSYYPLIRDWYKEKKLEYMEWKENRNVYPR